MKNKGKSAKVQQQVKIIQQQEAQKGKNKESLEKEKEKQRINEKKKAEAAKRELDGQLYGVTEIVQPKVPFGVGAFSFPRPLLRLSSSRALVCRPQDDPVCLPQGRQVHKGVR